MSIELTSYALIGCGAICGAVARWGRMRDHWGAVLAAVAWGFILTGLAFAISR